MLKNILNKLLYNNLEDLKESYLHVKIPFSKPIINLIFAELIKGNEQIEKISVKEIDGDIVKFNVTLIAGKIAGKKFELIDRELVIKIHPYIAKPDFLIKIEVLEGIGKFANELLEILFNTMLENDPVDFENKFFLIRHREFSENDHYRNFLEHIVKGELLTEKDKIVYDLHFKFD